MATIDVLAVGPNVSVAARWSYISEHPGALIPYMVILVVLILLGTFGNCLVIATILCIKELRTTANMFLCNLAIADLSVSSIVNTFNLVAIFQGEDWFSARAPLCPILSTICLLACAASLYNMAGVALNRYIHICHNHLYDRIFTPTKTFLMCVLIWILVFVNGDVPIIFGFGSHGFDRKSFMCVWDRLSDYRYRLYLLLFGIVLTELCMFVFYAKLFLYVRAKRRDMVIIMRAESVAAGQSMTTRARRDSVRLARTLFIIFVTCVAMWTPYIIEIIYDGHDKFPFQIHLFCSLLTHANSCINVIIYGVTNKEFRKGYIKVLYLEHCCPKTLIRDARIVYTSSVYSIQDKMAKKLPEKSK